jgi:hypothetical protein
MTIEIAELRCPSCGHLMGEEEYRDACDKFNRTVQASSTELIDKIRTECEAKIHKLENRIDQEAELLANRKLSEHEEESARMREEYEHKLKLKDM